MPQLPDAPPGIALISDEEMDRLNTIEPLPTVAQCVTCRGSLGFRWWADSSRTEIVDWECNCTAQWIMHTGFRAAGIGLVYQRLQWADYRGEEGALAKVFEYAQSFDWNIRNGYGLVLYGEIGTGKTLLSSLLLKMLMAGGTDGYLTTFSAMIDRYTAGWYDADERKWFHRKIKNAGVLVIDDIGREMKRSGTNALPESTFDEVLRHRISFAKPTIITTNLGLDELHTGYGGNVMSLLTERSTTYKFTGSDYRRTNQERLQTEARDGIIRPVVID